MRHQPSTRHSDVSEKIFWTHRWRVPRRGGVLSTSVSGHDQQMFVGRRELPPVFEELEDLRDKETINLICGVSASGS